ncbi:hypothetical protein ACHQM5_009139 [Ranunculus cassubicifolius]
MALRVSYLLGLTLWLSLLLFIVHEAKSHSPSLLQHNRKLLATTFDFSAFQKHHHRHHHHSNRDTSNSVFQPEPDGSEIDPRYGVEKRLVPSGPNPLHH